MEQKITVQQFAESVASVSGMQSDEALRFIKLIFKSVAEKLHEGEPVELQSVGRFSLSKTSPDRVCFTPDASLADAVNAPFVSFAAVELSDDYEDEPEPQIETEPEIGTETEAEIEPEADNSESTDATDSTEQTVVEIPVIPVDTVESVEIPHLDNVIAEEVEKTPAAVDEPVEEANVEEPFEEVKVEEPDEEVKVDGRTEETSANDPVNEHEVYESVTTTAIPEIPQATPPPFDPLKAYSRPRTAIKEDEEEFVDNAKPENKEGGKFIYGLISGVVIAAAVAALAFFVYEVFLA